MDKRILILVAFLAVAGQPSDVASARLFHKRSCCCCIVRCQSTATPEKVAVPERKIELFTSPSGRVYRTYLSEEVPPSDADEVAEAPREKIFAWRANGQDYVGNDRKIAKTTIARARIEHFDSLSDLLHTLPSDDFMRHDHVPRLSRDPDFDRVDEEDRNVEVEAWIYAAKKETNDNDYHLLVGNGPRQRSGRNMMNMEITGLPRNEFRDRLQRPRQDFLDFLGGQEPPTNRYRVFPDPIRVRIKGSLFYDIDHPPGIVGTDPYMPEKAWEVHPITSIEFLDE